MIHTIKTFGARLVVGKVYTIKRITDTYDGDSMVLNGVELGDACDWHIQNIFGSEGSGKSITVLSLDADIEHAMIEDLQTGQETLCISCGKNLLHISSSGTSYKYLNCTECLNLLPGAISSPIVKTSDMCDFFACTNPRKVGESGYVFTFCDQHNEALSGDTYKPLSPSTPTTGENLMNGIVYQGHVVRTRTVAAGHGVTTGVQVSEVIYTSKPFVATNIESARAVILAQAIVDVKGGLDVLDPTQPVEVKLITAS